jgi:hypothetical protein
MGIHHTYKTQRGERSLKKQLKQSQRLEKSQRRKQIKQKQKSSDTYVAEPNEVITMELLTNPEINKK